MDIHITISNRGLATIAAGAAAAGLFGYLWVTRPRDEITSYNRTNAPVSRSYETRQPAGVPEPTMVQYDTGVHSSISDLRHEQEKANRARKTEFEANMSVDAVPQQILADLQCDNLMEKMQAQSEDIDGDGIPEIKAYCPEWMGASGSFYFNIYRLSQKIYTGGNFAVSDEIINGKPVLYEFTETLLGSEELSMVERRKGMIVKHVFDGEKYKAAMGIIDRKDLADGINSVRNSALPESQKKKQFAEAENTFGTDAMIDAYSYAEGIDAVSSQQFQAYLDATGAYAQQSRLTTPFGLAEFFAERFVHHATARPRYEKETRELAGHYPRLAQWISANGIPDPDRRTELMRDNWSAIYETPPEPFRARDTIATERSSSPYGSTERYRFSPGANPSQVQQRRRDYAIDQDRQRIESNRQDFYNSPVGRSVSGAENAARSFGGAAIDAGRQAAPQVQRQLEGAARGAGNILQNILKPPEKKKN